MDSERTKIIINEIKIWKKSRMLPEKYCDYLLALYTKGDQRHEDVLEQKKQSLTVIQMLNSLFLITLVPLSFFVIYITKLSSIMQVFLLILFLIYSFQQMIKNQKEKNILFSLALFVSMLNFLLMTILIGKAYMTNNGIFIQFIGMFQFILWLIYAYKINRTDIKIISLLGFSLSIGYIFI